ncbi:MAG TPA: response regulator transcription factor [Candidatus Limnocylindrales bacterium]|nr:response regulator transcription factor [Candidatus Limnocylindrales bacterium]
MIRVLIVDDDPLVRTGLTMMLREYEDLDVVGVAGDGDEAVEAVRRHTPRVVLMDIRMPRTDGLTATERLRAMSDPPEVIVLTTFDTDAHIRRAMRVGASGFLLKHTPPDRIADAIRQVASGEPMLSPDVLRRVMSIAAEPDPDPRRHRAGRSLEKLSASERQVADLVGQGLTNAEIGERLRMSTATVKGHVSRILTKLDLTNRVQIALLIHDLS